MEEYKRYHVGNAHDGDYERMRANVPDYYPLTPEEISGLLSRAQLASDQREIASIELRLCQGIWGHTSGIPLHGPLADVVRWVRLVYRQNYRSGPVPELVEELCDSMRSTFPG